MKKPLLLIPLLLVFCFAINSAAIAQPLVCETLDDYINFANNPTELNAGNVGPVNFLDEDTGILGNFREINYGPIMFTFPLATTDLGIQNGTLSLSNGVTASSVLQLVYDANNAGLNLDFSTRDLLRFVLSQNDIAGTSFNLVLRDSNGNEADSFIANFPSTNQGDILPIDIDLPIANFVGIGNVDLTDIQAIEIVITPNPNGASDLELLPIEICGPPPPAEVPTLSEWGLIAMAGFLGIIGFMVMRRKRATA